MRSKSLIFCTLIEIQGILIVIQTILVKLDHKCYAGPNLEYKGSTRYYNQKRHFKCHRSLFKLSSLIFMQYIQFDLCGSSNVLCYLFNLFFNDFLLFILIGSVHNFADDNSSSNNATVVDSIKPALESECKAAINWFHEIIIAVQKFQWSDWSNGVQLNF